jgi:hypothetical protein
MLPDRAWEVDRIFIGRDATEADKAERVRIVPLPSIGHEHADHAIRRVVLRRALSQYSGLIGRPIGRLQEACA